MEARNPNERTNERRRRRRKATGNGYKKQDEGENEVRDADERKSVKKGEKDCSVRNVALFLLLLPLLLLYRQKKVRS